MSQYSGNSRSRKGSDGEGEGSVENSFISS
jgi:hypothetical protein